MVPPHGEVCRAGHGSGHKSSVRNGTFYRRSGSGYLGWYMHYVPSLGTEFPGGGLGFLLIYARNEFNEDNRAAMLWYIRHEWPSDMQLTFNLYCHWAKQIDA